MSVRSARRFRVWYGLMIVAVLVGAVVLDRAVAAQDTAIVMALVLAGLGYVVLAGLVAILRLVRDR